MIVDDEPFNTLAIKGLIKCLGVENVDDIVDVCYDGL